MCFKEASSRIRSTPATAARASRVRSSWVGPRPPLARTIWARCVAMRKVLILSSSSSATVVCQATGMPISASRRLSHWLLVSRFWPLVISVPIEIISAFIFLSLFIEAVGAQDNVWKESIQEGILLASHPTSSRDVRILLGGASAAQETDRSNPKRDAILSPGGVTMTQSSGQRSRKKRDDSEKTEQVVLQACPYVEANLEGPHALEALSDAVGVSAGDFQ